MSRGIRQHSSAPPPAIDKGGDMTSLDHSARPAAEADRPSLAAWRGRHELRRSSAARPHRNRKHYTRKAKHRDVSTKWYRGDRVAVSPW